MTKKLRKLFNEKYKEELKAIWDSGNHLDAPGGYKVTDWIKQQERNNLLTKIRDKKK